ncbi:MAG: hypothetical protein ACLFU2_03990 [Opitutales bacterium]
MLERFGASPSQATVMARQLYKRSAQRAEEKGIPQATALQELVELTIRGVQGEGPSTEVDRNDRPPPANPEK